jgi:hypothetical protein
VNLWRIDTRYSALNATKLATTDKDVKRTYILRIDESLRYFTFDFIFLFLPCIMPHVFIYFIMHCVVYLYCIMFNVFVISHVLTQVFNIMQDGASVPTPGGEVR